MSEAAVDPASLAATAPWLASARAAIASAEAGGRLPHALLIQGIAGLGKAALAEWIARYALCEAPGADACGVCPSCRWVAAGNHPDLMRVGVEEDKKQIAVDSVRAMITALTLKSYRGRRKVALLQPADALNANGANALLKTLEEPSGSALLILVAARPERLPATVASRCQRIKVRPPTGPVAVEWLAAQRSGTDWSTPLALTAGAPLAALAWADIPQVEAEMAELPDLLGRGHPDIPALAERCQKHYPAERFRCIEHWIAGRIRYGLTAPPPADPARPDAARVRRRHVQALCRLLDETRRARALLNSNAAPAMLFEQVFVSLARELASLNAARRAR